MRTFWLFLFYVRSAHTWFYLLTHHLFELLKFWNTWFKHKCSDTNRRHINRKRDSKPKDRWFCWHRYIKVTFMVLNKKSGSLRFYFSFFLFVMKVLEMWDKKVNQGKPIQLCMKVLSLMKEEGYLCISNCLLLLYIDFGDSSYFSSIWY